MVKPYWTLSQAFRWILWRRIDVAEMTSSTMLAAQLAQATGAIQLQVPSYAAGRMALQKALRSGAIVAVDQGRQVLTAVWAALLLGFSEEGIKIKPDNGRTDEPGPAVDLSIVPVNPKVPSAAVMAAWPPKALHTAHRTITEHADAWHRASPGALGGPAELALRLIALAAEGVFDRFAVAPRDARGDLAPATFHFDGSPMPCDDIVALLRQGPAVARDATSLVLLAGEPLRCWQESDDGREFARRYQLSEPGPADDQTTVTEPVKKLPEPVSLPSALEEICRRLIEEKKTSGAPRYPKTKFVSDVESAWGQPLGDRRKPVRQFHTHSALPAWKTKGNKPRIADTTS